MLSNLLSGGLVGSVGKIIDELHTSDEEKGQIKIKLQELENELNQKQMEINLADAKSTATGIGGIMQRSWRPLIGMSCALAIAWEYVIKQFLMFVLATFSIQTAPLPELDMATLFPLVTALLGMAGLRSFEKSKGISK
jgi:hypothetical protein